jgi:L-ascorbate metabolism protein UlaG (beta-lactamase superfamily)
MQITFYGHACFEIEIGGKKLLFDPFITPNEKASHIDVEIISPDYILLSHGHEDHVADAVTIAKRAGSKVISNFEIVTWMASQGAENGHPMNIGGKWQFDFGTVTYTNAIHSSVLPDGTYGGNPGGFIIESNEGSFYFAGDTALHYDMKLIGEYHNIDFALLPIGDNFTMGVKDAVRAAKFISCNNIIGMHFDTFGYIEINHEQTKKEFTEAEINLTLMEIGESKTI